MKKIAIILVAAIILASVIGCANSNIKYGYEGDYKHDPLLRQDIERDRSPQTH
jgi:hypothetical protein